MDRKYLKKASFFIIFALFSQIVVSTAAVSADTASQLSEQNAENSLVRSNNSVTITANKEEFNRNDAYQLSINLQNQDGDEIPIGTQITLNIPSAAISYDDLDFSDPKLAEFFDFTTDKVNGKIILTLKKAIVGLTDIKVNISGLIVGPKGSSYDVSAEITGGIPLTLDNPKIIIIDPSTNPPPFYDLINVYWGYTPSNLGTFVGRDANNINGKPVGNFSRIQNELSNFIEMNPTGKYTLDENNHYQASLTMTPIDGQVATVVFNKAAVKVFDMVTGVELPEENYQIQDGAQNELIVTLKSPNEAGGAITANHGYRITYVTNVNNDGAVYLSHSTLNVLDTNNTPVSAEKTFDLNNKFSPQGHSDIFPNLVSENKIYYAGELTPENIRQRLLENITAQDTTDGSITNKIAVDFGDLLAKANTPGEYPDQVTFSVINSSGNQTTRTIKVTIIEKADAAPVTVKYVDEADNELAIATVMNGKVGNPYISQAKSIPGWTLKSTPNNANGTFSLQEQTVTYIYEKADAAPVTLKYVDEENHELAEADILNGKIGNPYSSSAKNISNWTVKTIPENASGLFSNQAQTVTYVYERADAAPITIQYVDTEGNELISSETLNGKMGVPYQTTAKELNGWVVKTVPANANGTFSDQTQMIIYVYEKANAAPVTVKYLDTAGNELAPPDVLNGKIDVPYSTNAKKLSGWRLKATPNNANGTFTTQAQIVTYIYEKAEDTQAKVIVTYVDEDGNELAPSDVLTGRVGENYDTAAKPIDSWSLKTAPHNAKGIFRAQAQNVTYIYQKAADDIATNSTDLSSHDKSMDTLPKTGEEAHLLPILLGISLSFIGSYSFFKKKSKRVRR